MLDGASRGVFSGRVIVRPGRAEDRRAADEPRTSCSPTTPRSTRKPQLEIYADDVKCSHGATIGQLDEDALFYLRSRGIGEARRAALLDARLRGARCSSASRRDALRERSARARSPRIRGVRAVSRSRPAAPVADALDVARLRARLPDPRPPHPRQAARLPRQRGERAEAARRDRRGRRASTPTTTPTCTAASTSSSERATRRLRGARASGAAVPRTRATRTRSSSLRGTTEAINLVAASCGRAHVGAGDEILITEMEHHSNIVPWQMLCEEHGARLRRRADRRRRRARPRRVRARCSPSARGSSRSRTSRTRSAP